MSLLQKMARAIVDVHGLAPAGVPTSAASGHARKAIAATPTREAARAKPDRVLVLGGPGVLVRASDGRLPRDGEVEPDGVSLRVVVTVSRRGVPVLVAGALRKVPTACRWSLVEDLHRIDLEILKWAAPGHLADMRARDRVAALAREVAVLCGVGRTVSAEEALTAALAALQHRAVSS